ncbi:5-methyltetrahydropteroyltriglutamate-homocysteine methyltransferase [Zancudomyces culisetae]|uniref:5-methyltetrahydropteroyltriglutamate--homocysteine S-methyltransferase n=1 Tax=Zancudomyces culisetae TaxID=1213189 RepID=A0A1R1PSJ1_ZANCU|nr:5-methyltetrahydropteroyltriglutamate-homocysteine methyltransferase [Zancudomyces culisetae]|eukprot:OMH83928.1 5-methyltetrahydropteroyltriglutamate-homocysteine methyltransferase [Zancudomyces culisetae]
MTAEKVATILGFPRMGKDRELKKCVEGYWSGKINVEELISISDKIKEVHWELQVKNGLDVIPVGDFSLYDHILDTAFMFNVIPERYIKATTNGEGLTGYDLKNIKAKVDTYFGMARGITMSGNIETDGSAQGVQALEMKKWFDTNYHCIVPEIDDSTSYALVGDSLVNDYKKAVKLGYRARPCIIGPVTFLHYCNNVGKRLSKADHAKKLVSVYVDLIKNLAGAEWIQLDEPVLSLDLDQEYVDLFLNTYNELLSGVHGITKVMLVNYFGAYEDNFTKIVSKLPIDGIHFDLVYGLSDFESTHAIDKIKNTISAISLGVVDGRNIWKTDLAISLEKITQICKSIGNAEIDIWFNSSCSLLHVPHSLDAELGRMDSEILQWISFSVEKIRELSLLKNAYIEPSLFTEQINKNKHEVTSRLTSQKVKSIPVQQQLKEIPSTSTDESVFSRNTDNYERRRVQRELFKLRKFPTTTIGSFPQTLEVRKKRQEYLKGIISKKEYDTYIREKTKKCIEWQLELGLDVLVHGEYERTDMVEFFGEHFTGFCKTNGGWVQSYGSRCVKPPIIYGDISRPKPMTVELIEYAQSLLKGTGKYVKGMLTGPVTILRWSFVRNDQSLQTTATQIALALQKEVLDLEVAGIKIIQVDEPAIREGLPLRKKDQISYFKWAANCFKLVSQHVSNSTQIHTHMCYSDFNDILHLIKDMDADVLTIENSKSSLKNFKGVKGYYEADIGPGLYDVHSPRIPLVEEMKARVHELLKIFTIEQLWINPDCGNKTRTEREVDLALKNMVQVSRELEASFKKA